MIFLTILSKAVFASVVALGFGIISNPPRRAILSVILTGFLGYLLRATMMDYFDIHIFISCLCSAFLMGCCGLVFGKMTRTPATVIYIPALLPMIPGMYAYKSIFAFINYMNYIELSEKAIYLEQFFTNFVYTIGILILLAGGSIMPMFLFTRTANSLTRN